MYVYICICIHHSFEVHIKYIQQIKKTEFIAKRVLFCDLLCTEVTEEYQRNTKGDGTIYSKGVQVHPYHSPLWSHFDFAKFI